jgi:hypothetical protein
MLLKNPHGWSKRFAAAKDRVESQKAHSLNNAERHAHIRKGEVEREFEAKLITKSERDRQIAEIVAHLDAVRDENAAELARHQEPDPADDTDQPDSDADRDAADEAAAAAEAARAAAEQAALVAAEAAAKDAAEKDAAGKAAAEQKTSEDKAARKAADKAAREAAKKPGK